MKFSSAGILLFTFVCVLATHALTASAEAEDPPVSAMSRSLEELPPSQVAAADRISLRFQGQPDISGEYHVSPDGTLSVPVIGRISIADMSLAQLEQDLTRRVTEFAGRPTYVTAEIVAYRPIFVTGFVSRPGAVEWRPGLTVLQAEALVGGLYRAPELTNSHGEIGSVETLRSMRSGREQQKLLLATLARLKTEKAGSAQIEVPPALVNLVGEEEAKALIDGQQSLLDSRRSGLEKKKAAIERGIAIAGEELEGLKGQRVRVDEQLQLRRGLQEKITELLQKGLVPRERSLESDIRIAELEEKGTNIAVARARVESTAAMLQQDAVTIEEDRAAGIDAEIAKLESELAQVGIDVEAAMQTYNRVASEAARATATPLPRMVIKYTIIRRSEAGEERAAAQTSSYLQPGDVLLVSQEVEQGLKQTQDMTGGDETGRTGEAK